MSDLDKKEWWKSKPHEGWLKVLAGASRCATEIDYATTRK